MAKTQYGMRIEPRRRTRRQPHTTAPSTHTTTHSSITHSATCLGFMVFALALLGACMLRTSAVAQASTPSHPQVYFGLMYPGTPAIDALGKYEAQLGKPPSLILWYQSWIEGHQLQAFPAEKLEAVREHGAIPVLAWEPDEYPPPAGDRRFSLASIAAGAWDAYIQQYAAQAKAWGHPFFLRFASEMNGNWTPWSEQAAGNGGGQFVKAWRHVHDLFTAAGATNVTWVWCPNVEDITTTPLEDLYPGAGYVDWLGMDGYNYSVDLAGAPWRGFSQIFRTTYAHLVALTPPDMPIMIGETGSVENGGSKANWITDALTTQLPARFPRVKALIWFDSVDGRFNLRYDTSPQALAAFRDAIGTQTYPSNIYAALDQSPIPAPEDVAPPAAATLPPPPAAVAVPTADALVGGPAPGVIQTVDVHGDPLARATLLYHSGATTTTDAQGQATIPTHEPHPVLERVVIQGTIILTQVAVDSHRGYEVQVDRTARRVVRVLVRVTPWPIMIQAALILSLLLIIAGGHTMRRVRRDRRVT